MSQGQQGYIPCPFCGENIRSDALKCRFCGEVLDQQRYRAARNSEGAPPSGPEPGGSEPIYAAKPSSAAMIGAFFRSALFWVALGFIAFYPLQPVFGAWTNKPWVQFIAKYRVWFAFVVAAIDLAALLIKLLILKAEDYTVSRDRLEIQKGVFSKQVDNLDMFRIKDIRLNRSLWDRMLGVGTVTLETSDASHPIVELTKIRRSKKVYDMLKAASLDADKRQRVIHYE